MLKFIVDYIVLFIKQFLFELKKDMMTREIKISKEELFNAKKINDDNYNDFVLSYEQYKSSKLRSSAGEVCKDCKKPTGCDKETGKGCKKSE